MKTKSKSKSGIKIGIATTATLVIVIAALAAFSSPVSAQGDPGAGCPSTTQFYDTIKGGIYFEQQGWMKKSGFEVTFDDVPDNIKVARVYTGVWGGSPSKGGVFNITVNGNLSPTYTACDPCPQPQNCNPDYQEARCDTVNETECHDYVTGCNVHFISYNATQYIQQGSNTIKVMDGCTGECTCWDSRIYLIALLVVYEDTSMPNMTYWINEGQPYMEKGSACDGNDSHYDASFYFNGTYTTTPSRVRYWTLGFPHVFNASVPPAYTKLNNNTIGYPDHTVEHGGYEVLLRWDNIPTGYLTNNNLLKYHDEAPYYERAGAAVFVVQGAITEPNLVADDIIFPDTLRPGKTHTIKAKITNMGLDAGSFNVTLYANGTSSYSYKENVGLLLAGQSTTVDFSSVTLPYDCYEFKVVADSDGDITEFNENDNTRKENYQVGHYIVVKSNDDFETLLSDTGLPANSVTKDVSGTYYIQNLTVENCFGCGIDIENTDVHFVINNCTAQNCEYGGVFLHSVTNGKVTNSVAQNNALKGIKVVNSTYVTIANNTAQNNDEYGIDVYPGLMSFYQLSEYITIKNNTLTGNMYGIELIGKYCTVCDNNISSNTAVIPGSDTGHGIRGYGMHHEIYNNTIAYNDNYGIYMDFNANSNPCTQNCIYGNTLTDNNVQFPSHTSQGYDSGANWWNSTVKLGYYYGGTGASYANDSYIGNNWSDYGGIDGNNDGIGNTWYAIDDISPVQHAPSENDTAPLMQPWMDYERIDCGDVDASGSIQFIDYVKLRKHYLESYLLSSEWAGDVDCIGGIQFIDYVKLRKHYLESYALHCCTGC